VSDAYDLWEVRMQHPNARLTVRGRLELVRFVENEGHSFRQAPAAYFLRGVGVGVWDAIVAIVAGLAISGGTKPPHDLITNSQQSKKRSRTQSRPSTSRPPRASRPR
jgi:hypothetical protein